MKSKQSWSIRCRVYLGGMHNSESANRKNVGPSACLDIKRLPHPHNPERAEVRRSRQPTYAAPFILVPGMVLLSA